MKHSLFSQTLLFISILFLLTLSGCSKHRFPSTSNKNTQITRDGITALNLQSLQTLNSILPQLATHKVVLVGERHTQYHDHLNQLAVIKGLHQKWNTTSSKLAIGLEMIQQPFQFFLDDYIAGEINEKQMLRGTQWYDRWRYDFRLYRPIFSYAKQHKIPLVALNIPKELTRQITKVGFRGLNKNERKQLPEKLDKSNTAYVKRLQRVFNMHSHTSSKGFDKFLEAQLAWDEGMAWHAARFLQKHPQYKMVILAGGGHIINREGIPDRLEKRIHSKPAVVLNNVHGIPNPTNGDFLLFSKEKKLPPSGKLGIIMSDTQSGVTIEVLLPNSAAAKAGLRKGDIILRLDEMPIKNSADIRIWSLDKKPLETVTAIVQRKKQTKSYSLILKKKTQAINMHK